MPPYKLNEYDPYTSAEAVNSLPTKRIFDFESHRLRESTKLPNEFSLTNDKANELVLKVKLVGINYQTDFKSFLYNPAFQKSLQPTPNKQVQYANYFHRTTIQQKPLDQKRSPLVPGSRIIGKLQAITTHPDMADFKENPNAKYLVFPFTNCINQNGTNGKLCNNCAFLCKRISKNNAAPALSEQNIHHWSGHPCLKNLVYGSTIDGGLQDYIKVSTPKQTLLKIPDTVSLHDACFFLDIMLPFYSFCQEYFMDTPMSPISADGGSDDFFTNRDMVNFGGNVLIILNDVAKEINDILIVLKHFGIDENTVRFIDHKQLKMFTETDRINYRSQFSQIFVFNPHDDLIKFAISSCSSPGLESTKTRYNIVLFDQFSPESLAKNKHLGKYHTDKCFHQFKLSFKDKYYAEKLLHIISNLNLSIKQTENVETAEQVIPSSPSSRNSSTFSNSNSLHSDHSDTLETLETKPLKSIRFRDDDSIINDRFGGKKSSGSSYSGSSNYSASRQHFSWLWYDKDIALCNDYEQSDDEDGDDDDKDLNETVADPASRKSHSVKQLNKLVYKPRQLHRVCYTNRANRPEKLNAFIFS